MRKSIKIGSRGSRLALIQAESVATKIRELYPYLELETVKIITKGDRDQSTSLEKMGNSAFVKELEKALLSKRIDIAVHSLKDIPTETPEGLCIIAIPDRLDPRDVLISKSGQLNELPAGSRIGTGSLRRATQLLHFRADFDIRDIRGNIDTRLRKVSSGELDAIITAAAAMIRLQCEDKITEYLPTELFLPAAGQGALAIESRFDDDEINHLISPLNCAPAWQSTMAERSFISTIGAGCRTPVAVLGTVISNNLKLEAMIADMTSKQVIRASEEGNPSFPEQTGLQLARKMIELGASQFINKGN